MTHSLPVATRGGRPRVALVTCADLPELDRDDRLAAAALVERGVAVIPAVWDDPSVDWSAVDLAVVRNTWDYTRRLDEFRAWARRVPRLANPAEVICWNTDKSYLAGLADAGVPVVPTEWLAPGGPAWQPPARGEYVVKPAVSAGSVDTGRYDLGRGEHRELAEKHVVRLLAAGRTVMVQPYLAAVDSHGETALVHFRGAYSHAIRKGAMLDGPYTGVVGLYKKENIIAREPTRDERAAAERVLDSIPGVRAADLLYARVDLIPGPAGEPLLVELELTEPTLFLGRVDGAAGRFADAVVALLAEAGAGQLPG